MNYYTSIFFSALQKHAFYFLLIILCNAQYNLAAQEIQSSVISNCGKAIVSAEIGLSYTVGEAVSYVLSSSNENVIQGFEQPKVDTLSVSVFENNIEIPVKIYPNPTIGPVNIEIESLQNIDWKLSIYNIEGKLMSTYQINSGLNTITLNQYPTANYVLVVSSKNGNQFTSHIIEKIN